jgi:hypothetical protein
MQIFCIPDAFDTDAASTSSTFVDSIIRWKYLQDNSYYEWQEFLHMYRSDVDFESDQWMEEFLCNLMDKALKIEAISDFDELPQQRCGAVSLFQCMVKRMVLRIEESHHALEKWLQDFSITNFSGENVTLATIRIKAVANAIDDLNL